MCFSYSVNFNAEALKSRLQLDDILLPETGFFFSAFTWPHLPVILGRNGTLYGQTRQWGLIPGWCKDEKQAAELRKLALNAKGETVFQKPMFRGAFKNGRCLVPAAGFFEWREIQGKKYPYYIESSDNSALLFAGISENWTNPDTGELVETYCIVTTTSNKLLSFIHNTKLRMPLIFNDEEAHTWIFGTDSEALELVKPCDDRMLSAHTVSRLASNPRVDRNVEEVQMEFHYPETDQAGLF